jgi:xylulose-5-phosphate/fructose-6-phosphate phosphoketolase
MFYIAGPGHSAPAILSNCYLEGTYSEAYPEKNLDETGMLRLFQAFSFPG